MTATTAPTFTTSATEAPTTPLWRISARSGLLAALATTMIAAVALGVGVPVEVDSEQIQLLGFAQLTLMATAIGYLLAKALARWAATPRRTFAVTTVALTVLSCVPDVIINATTATKFVLITTHVVAASIVIPAVAGRLAEHR